MNEPTPNPPQPRVSDTYIDDRTVALRIAADGGTGGLRPTEKILRAYALNLRDCRARLQAVEADGAQRDLALEASQTQNRELLAALRLIVETFDYGRPIVRAMPLARALLSKFATPEPPAVTEAS